MKHYSWLELGIGNGLSTIIKNGYVAFELPDNFNLMSMNLYFHYVNSEGIVKIEKLDWENKIDIKENAIKFSIPDDFKFKCNLSACTTFQLTGKVETIN